MAGVGALEFAPKKDPPPKMLAAWAAAGGLVAVLPKIDAAEDVGDEKAFEVPNALAENRPPPLFEFSDAFGLQMEKSLKIDPTSEEAVVVGGVGVAVDATDEGVPKPPKMEADVELADPKPKVDVGEVAAIDGFGSLAIDFTETIDGVTVVAAAVGVPNTLLANGEMALLVAVVAAVDEIPNPLKIEEVSGAVVAAIGAVDVSGGAVLPKILAGELTLLVAFAKLKVVAGDAILVAAVRAMGAGEASDVFTKFIGDIVTCDDSCVGSFIFVLALVENRKLVAGDAIEAVGFTGADVPPDVFDVAGLIPSNASTMLGDSAASETFSAASFAAGGVADAL